MSAASLTRRSVSRRWLASVLAMVLLAGMIALAVTSIDLRSVGRAISHARVGWLLIAALLFGGNALARSESWFATLCAALPGMPLSRGFVIRAALLGSVTSTVAPGRIGEAVRTWLVCRRLGARACATVAGTVIAQVLMNVTALALLAAIGLGGGAIPGMHASALIGAVLVPVLLIGLLAASARLARGSHPLARVLRGAGDGLATFARARSALHSVGVQWGAWALQLGTCYAVLAALGLEHRASVASAAALLFAVNVTAAVPATPSSIGVFQATCVAVLVPLGVSSAGGLAYGLVLQGIEVCVSLLLGIPALLCEGLSPAALFTLPRLRAERAASDAAALQFLS